LKAFNQWYNRHRRNEEAKPKLRLNSGDLVKNKSRIDCFLLLILLTIVLKPGTAAAQDTHFAPKGQQIPTPECLIMKGAWEGGSKPCSVQEHEAWLADIRHWRTERRIRIGYNGSRYDLPALKWTQSSFIQPQMMVEDRYFYDPVAHKYTVDRYLDDVEKRYGGIDAVLIWPTYPNMGIDNRNQHDMIRAMPGGIPGVRQMIAATFAYFFP
jgi:iron(II)-dependent oxidoreductase